MTVLTDSTESLRAERPEPDRRESAITEMLNGSAAPTGLATDLHMMAGAVINDDGTAHFCDALGQVLRKPVSGWIAFMAQRLWFQARQEMARQIGNPDLSDEGRVERQERLRRELRLDALAILSHRHDEAFRLALASETDLPPLPAPRQFAVGLVSPEIIRAVESHREAAQLHIHDPVRDARRVTAAERRIRALGQAIVDTPARSLADLRHKLIYLWPGSIDEYVTHGSVAEIVQGLHDEVLRLAASPTREPAGHVEVGQAMPADLAGACRWAARRRIEIDALCRSEDWSDETFDAESEKVDAVFIRAIEEPSRSAADVSAKAALALEDFERFIFPGPLPDAEAKGDDGERLVRTVLRETAALETGSALVEV